MTALCALVVCVYMHGHGSNTAMQKQWRRSIVNTREDNVHTHPNIACMMTVLYNMYVLYCSWNLRNDNYSIKKFKQVYTIQEGYLLGLNYAILPATIRLNWLMILNMSFKGAWPIFIINASTLRNPRCKFHKQYNCLDTRGRKRMNFLPMPILLWKRKYGQHTKVILINHFVFDESIQKITCIVHKIILKINNS